MRRPYAVLFALACLGWASSPPSPIALGTLVEDAELIFEGGVMKVEYRSSEASNGAPGVPHTFVTYRIKKLLKGNSSEPDRVTLRFLGGPVGDSGRFLVVDSLPTIDRDDLDILFVKGNLDSECPLVQCARGRYRVIDGLVYSEDGSEVRPAPGGDIALGPHRELPDVDRWRIQATDFERVPAPGGRPGTTAPNPGQQLTDGRFVSLIEAHVGAPSSSPAPQTVVQSGRVNESFRYDPAPPSPPPTSAPPTQPAKARTDAERLERALLKSNRGNPVIPPPAPPRPPTP